MKIFNSNENKVQPQIFKTIFKNKFYHYQVKLNAEISKIYFFWALKFNFVLNLKF